jgi:predicted DNA-binding protein YlxM (UPF0122 family)
MQIQQIIKRKSEVLDDYESNVSSDRKRKRHKIDDELLTMMVTVKKQCSISDFLKSV